jgi:hypothetical protein
MAYVSTEIDLGACLVTWALASERNPERDMARQISQIAAVNMAWLMLTAKCSLFKSSSHDVNDVFLMPGALMSLILVTW